MSKYYKKKTDKNGLAIKKYIKNERIPRVI